MLLLPTIFRYRDATRPLASKNMSRISESISLLVLQNFDIGFVQDSLRYQPQRGRMRAEFAVTTCNIPNIKQQNVLLRTTRKRWGVPNTRCRLSAFLQAHVEVVSRGSARQRVATQIAIW